MPENGALVGKFLENEGKCETVIKAQICLDTGLFFLHNN